MTLLVLEYQLIHYFSLQPRKLRPPLLTITAPPDRRDEFTRTNELLEFLVSFEGCLYLIRWISETDPSSHYVVH